MRSRLLLMAVCLAALVTLALVASRTDRAPSQADTRRPALVVQPEGPPDGGVERGDVGDGTLVSPVSIERRRSVDALLDLIARAERPYDSTISIVATALQNDPKMVGELTRILDDPSTSLTTGKILLAAFGRTEVAEAHQACLAVARRGSAEPSLRCIAVGALGQRRGAAPRGPYLIASDFVTFGWRLEDPWIVEGLRRLLDRGTEAGSDPGIGVVRSWVARVLSANVGEQATVDALVGALPRAQPTERSSVLNALACAEGAVLSKHAGALQKALGCAEDGQGLGHGAAALIKAWGIESTAEVEAAFNDWLEKAGSDSALLAEAALAVSLLTSHLTESVGLHPWWRRFASDMLVGPRASSDSALRLQLVAAVARTVDPGLECPEAAVLEDALAGGRDERGVVRLVILSLGMNRLTSGGMARVMKAVELGAHSYDEATIFRAVDLVASAAIVPEEDLMAWAQRLDGLTGRTDLGARAEGVRSAVRHR